MVWYIAEIRAFCKVTLCHRQNFITFRNLSAEMVAWSRICDSAAVACRTGKIAFRLRSVLPVAAGVEVSAGLLDF